MSFIMSNNNVSTCISNFQMFVEQAYSSLKQQQDNLTDSSAVHSNYLSKPTSAMHSRNYVPNSVMTSTASIIPVGHPLDSGNSFMQVAQGDARIIIFVTFHAFHLVFLSCRKQQ